MVMIGFKVLINVVFVVLMWWIVVVCRKIGIIVVNSVIVSV